MLYPDFETFNSLSLKGNLVPVYREILADTETPVSAAMKLGGSPLFLLESVEGGEKWARYSFLGSQPSRSIRSWGKKVEIRDNEEGTRILETENPFDVLQKRASRGRSFPQPAPNTVPDQDPADDV